METISCPSHRRATALPLPAKVTSTKWFTETAQTARQPTAHPEVRLGPDSSLRRTSPEHRAGRESSGFPAPLPLSHALLWQWSAQQASTLRATLCQVPSLLDRLEKTANPVQLPVRLGHSQI